jgi:hypothetical protein
MIVCNTINTKKEKRRGSYKETETGVVPVHSMEAYRKRSGMAPLILNLGVRWT